MFGGLAVLPSMIFLWLELNVLGFQPLVSFRFRQRFDGVGI
jgi:hypothetical protein